MCRIRASPSRCRRAICPAATARPTSRSSTSPCRPRHMCGGTTRSASTAIRRSSWRTSSDISGGARRSAGRTTTSSGSAKASRSISRRCTPNRNAAPRRFEDVLRQMRRWAIDTSPQGPVYLGYRLGHIKSDSRVFRAVIYNKAAMVLHMLRRMVGDEAFFRGHPRVLRRVAVPEGRHRRLPRGDGRARAARI